MAEEKPKQKSQRGATNTELINVRFYENQKRQALLTTTVNEEEDVGTVSNDDVLSSGETTENFCDTVVDVLKIPNAPQSSEAVPVDSTSSSLAISAPSDKSRKGSVDQKIWNLVNLINRERDSFFTTSSCSGRIILYTWNTTDIEETSFSSSASVPKQKQKKGCKWLLVSHDEIEPEELVNAYLTTAALPVCHETTAAPTGERDVYFKMEPCILHVQCRTLSQAKKLIHIATESGFRNSGMVIGKENRITVAIRSAMGLEAPLPPLKSNENDKSDDSDMSNISREYLKYLTHMANSKMRENWLRSEKLTRLFSETLWKT